MMTARCYIATATTLVAVSVVVVLASSGWASALNGAGAAGRPPPLVAVEDCSTSPGWGRRDEFIRRANLVVGPLAISHARPMLAYAPTVSGNKVILSVKGGHRVTLEVARVPRDGAALGFGLAREGEWIRLAREGGWIRNAPRAVAFIACRRGERSGRFDGWPVTSWVGFLFASSPRCVPLLVWVDDAPNPRRAVIRFGVPSCG